jgi:hypothetical protein
MKIVAIKARSLANARTASLCAGLLCLVATGPLLAGCTGGAHTQDRQYWTEWYGTPGTVQPFCCGHAERNNNR